MSLFGLKRKLYGKHIDDMDITLQKVREDMQIWEEQLQKMEAEDRERAYRKWRRKIVADSAYRASWINKDD